MANVIEIVVKGRDEGLGSGIDDVDRRAKGLKGTLLDVGKTAAGFLTASVFAGAGAKALDFFGDATKGASDLNESLSKSNIVFGASAKTVEAWASGAAKNIGLAKGEALEAAGSFGNMFTQLGFASDQGADMSMTMGDLAADFASFHNLDITDVLDAQSAAFRGEYDSAQRFLPLLSAANVEAEAMKETGKANADQLTAQEKAMATYTLMLQGAGAAQGNFALTADEAANSERIAQAEMENMRNEIGQKLLPVSRKITEIKLAFAKVLMERVVPALQKAGEWVQQKVIPALKDFWAWVQLRLVPVLINLGAWLSRNVLPPLAALGRFLVGTVIPALADFTDWLVRNQEVLAAIALGIMGALVPAFVAWAISAGAAAIATIAAAAPFILLAAAIAAFAYLVIHNWDTIKEATLAVFNFIKDIVSGVINWISENWPLLLAVLTGPIGLAVYFIAQHWEAIKNAASVAKQWIIDRWNELVSFVTGLPGMLASAAAGIWNWISSGIEDALNFVIRKVKSAITAVVDAFNNLPGPDITLNFSGMAKVGATARKAAGGPAGGMAWVGENGPELVRLPAGSHVIGASRSMDIAGAPGRGGFGGAEVIELHSHVYLDGVQITESVQRTIRTNHGGDVQAGLGWAI